VARYGSGDRRQEHLGRVESGADDAGNEKECRDETVVDPQDDVTQILPCFAKVVLVVVGRNGCGWSGHRNHRTGNPPPTTQ